MKGKLKKTVRESFRFPETTQKDAFFRMLEDRPVNQKKTRYAPVLLRFTAVAAAAVFCFSVWRSPVLHFETVLHRNDSMPAATEKNDSRNVTEATAAPTQPQESAEPEATVWAAAVDPTEPTMAPTQNIPNGSDSPGSTVMEPTDPVMPVLPTPPVIDDERSTYMKKLAAFTTAVTILTANGSLGVFAEYQPPEITPDVQAIVAHIDSTAPDLDFNCDGTFNALDLYAFHIYTTAKLTLTDDTMARCAANGDINQDGVIDFEDWRTIGKYAAGIGDAADTELDFNGDGFYFAFDDAALYDYVCISALCSEEEIAGFHANGDVNCDGAVDTTDARGLINYYVLKNDVTPEELRESHYERESVPDADWAWNFVYFLRCAISDYDMGYRNITEMVQSGELSLDLNADGITNILDAFDYYYYCSVKDTASDYEEYLSKSTPLLSRAAWEACAQFDVIRPDGSGYMGAGISTDYNAVVKYFLYNTEITEEMLDSAMYAAHHEAGSASFALTLKDMAEEAGVIAADGATINDALFWQYYDKYEAECGSGERALPDVDCNGAIDYEDYFAANIFFGDRLCGVACEESVLPADVWNHFNENCDFNENGVSGDVYDTTIVNIYVIKHAAEEPADFDAAYQAYIAALRTAKGLPDPSVLTAEQLGELMTAYNRHYDLLCDTDMERSGDANDDREISIVDAVAIAKSVAVSEQKQLSSKGRFNADICNTGDGVNAEDAGAILNLLLGVGKA